MPLLQVITISNPQALQPTPHQPILVRMELERTDGITTDDGIIRDSTAFRSRRPPPDGGYGWVCTLCVFLINAHTWGTNSAWAVILAHFMKHSKFHNASQTEYALIGGLSISQAFLIGPVVTKFSNMAGTPVTLLIGTLLEFGGLMSSSYAQNLWHLYLSQGVCFGFGMGFLYLPASSDLPDWFTTKRSFSMGIASSGAGLGGLAYNLVAGKAIAKYGVGVAYKVLAFCSLSANLFSSLLFRAPEHSNRPREPRKDLDLRDLLNVEILLLVLWGFTTELGYIALVFSLPHYASSIGLDPHQGSVTGAVLNLGLALGRPLIGFTSDKFGRITVPVILTLACGVLCLVLWVPAHSYPVLLIFALLAGMLCGIFWGTATPIMAEIVGLSRLAPVFTLICLIMVIPTTVAEIIVLELVNDSTYLSAQLYIASLFLAGSISLWIPRCWKFYDIEKKAADERAGIRRGDPSSFPGFFHWLRPRHFFLKGMV